MARSCRLEISLGEHTSLQCGQAPAGPADLSGCGVVRGEPRPGVGLRSIPARRGLLAAAASATSKAALQAAVRSGLLDILGSGEATSSPGGSRGEARSSTGAAKIPGGGALAPGADLRGDCEPRSLPPFAALLLDPHSATVSSSRGVATARSRRLGTSVAEHTSLRSSK